MLYCMQTRRYGQIDLSPRCHYHQVLVGATRWRFKSSCPHHQKALKTMNFQGFLVFSFCSYTAVGWRHVYDVKSTNRNLYYWLLYLAACSFQYAIIFSTIVMHSFLAVVSLYSCILLKICPHGSQSPSSKPPQTPTSHLPSNDALNLKM